MRKHERDYIRNTPGARLPLSYAFAIQAVREAGYREVDDLYARDAADWWVPICVMYEAYHAAWLGRLHPQPGDDDVELLSKRQFGDAISLGFPEAGWCRRRMGGKICVGRYYMVGPDGLRAGGHTYTV